MTTNQRGHEIPILIVLALGGFFLVNSFFGIAVAIPDIQQEFHTPLADLQWLSIMGWVMLTALALPLARLGDLVGRRKVYFVGLVCYAVGSGLAGIAGNFPIMMIFRAIMSLGVAITFPLAVAIAASTVSPERRGWALGIVASSYAAGRATGPILGGIIIQPWGWRSIFFLNFGVGVVAAVAALLLFRGIPEPRRSQPFDLKGALALMIAFPCLLIPITRGPENGWSSPPLIGMFVVAAVGLLIFIWAELKAVNPLMPLYHFKNRMFSAAVAALTIQSLSAFPILVFVPLYLRSAEGLSALEIGVQMTPLALVTAFFSTVGGRWSDRVDARSVSLLGLLIGVAGLFVYAQLGDDTSYPMIALAMVLIGISGGLFVPANQRAAFTDMSPEHFGTVSAILSVMSTAAGAIGTTIAVAIQDGRVGPDSTFAAAQQFTFMLLVPTMVLAALVVLLVRPAKTREPVEAAAESTA
ncbi:MAG TPA: MFS transporter [Dehalococcoidia bacterium]|nr:MFS transporter [Dehalococcoidia bacterium]